jgi:hypothetical protein
VLAHQQGQSERAFLPIERSLELEPDRADWHSGILLNGQKRSREAAVCFSKVVTLRPKHPAARRLLASTCLMPDAAPACAARSFHRMRAG